MPSAFEVKNLSPSHLTISENLKYDYMIYRLSKIFSINPTAAEKLSEIDFWLYAGFENLDNRRREYFIDNEKIS